MYLSRTRLEDDPRRSTGDDELDGRLRELGFAVVHPQELPIGDQLAAAAAPGRARFSA